MLATTNADLDLATIAAVIARSQIVFAEPSRVLSLPAKFDDADIAVLDWIAAEGRRARRVYVWM